MKLRLFGLFLATAIISVGTAWCISIPNESTSQQFDFWVTDCNGDPNLDIDENDLDIYILEEGSAISAKADLSAAARTATSTWASNKAFDCGQGMLRVWVANAAFDGGVGKHVTIEIRDTQLPSAGGDLIVPLTIQLGTAAAVYYVEGNAAPLGAEKLFNNLLGLTNMPGALLTKEIIRGEFDNNSVLVDDMAAVTTALSAMVLKSTTVAASPVPTTRTFTLNDGKAIAEYYPIGTYIIVTDLDDPTNPVGAIIQSYSATLSIMLTQALPFTPASGDTVIIMANAQYRPIKGTTP